MNSTLETLKATMYDDSIKLIEMPESGSVSVCVYNEQDKLFALGEKINAKHEEAYMNGYNWDALIRFYVGQQDPALMQEVETDPEAGMFSAYMSFSPENLEKMKRFESHVRAMLADDKALLQFIDDHCHEIAWD
jgi:Immunity protein 51